LNWAAKKYQAMCRENPGTNERASWFIILKSLLENKPEKKLALKISPGEKIISRSTVVNVIFIENSLFYVDLKKLI
jgi:hypothetical protein